MKADEEGTDPPAFVASVLRGCCTCRDSDPAHWSEIVGTCRIVNSQAGALRRVQAHSGLGYLFVEDPENLLYSWGRESTFTRSLECHLHLPAHTPGH